MTCRYEITQCPIVQDFSITKIEGRKKTTLTDKDGFIRWFSTRGSARKAIWRLLNG